MQAHVWQLQRANPTIQLSCFSAKTMSWARPNDLSPPSLTLLGEQLADC